MTTLLDRREDPRAEPAFSAPSHDVEAVNKRGTRDLYAARKKIYPKLGFGRFRAIKWAAMIVTLGIYYGLPWLRWNRGPDLPDQAVLLDMPSNRYFFFFLEIWPQEFYFITGLLILSALLLFLVTSVAGRVWCGYACPQTVWTDLMIAVERFWQGDRNARIRLDKEPWGALKVFKKVMTHLSWLAVGVLTGGALVFYFRDAPTLARELVTGTAPAIAYLFLAIFALTTYLLGGIAREQVCTYMCPWPRIQGAMIDQHTLLVAYRPVRGEPRGPARKDADGKVDWSTRGDCIDCKACVVVCPAGIDIRDGAQLECIQCALCVDACNDIMDKIGRPRGLIGYDTVAQQEANVEGKQAVLRLVRPRTLLYAGLAALVGAIMLAAWLNRTVLELSVQHERNPPYVQLSAGGVRNAYTVKILNKRHEPREFKLEVRELPGAEIGVAGASLETGGIIRVPTDVLRELKVLVTVPPASLFMLKGASTSFAMVVRDRASGTETSRRVSFQAPSAAAGGAP